MMAQNETQNERYSFYDYIFNKTIVRYVVIKETKNVFLQLLPTDIAHKANSIFDKVIVEDSGYVNHLDWYPGSLVHLHFSHHATPMPDNSFKLSESTKALRFENQEVETFDGGEKIKTYLSAKEGYRVCHTLMHFGKENGFEISTSVTNQTEGNLCLEMITSASLDNLSPFMTDDGSEDLIFHCFKGGWATEGKLVSLPLYQMNMEKSWGGSFECEKICVIGSKSVGRYHPYTAIEDKKHNCTWGVKLKHNSSWQMEISRYGTPLSLSAGLADYKSGGWRKILENGESFTTPVAYVSVSEGGIANVSNDLNEMNNRDIETYGEDGMPIIFNDWVTHWGNTSEDRLLSLANSLKNSKVKYFVVDDGWQKGGVGDWEVDEKKFPNGLKSYAEKIRDLGMVPGIWMELENLRINSKRFAEEFDEYNITKDGIPLKNAMCNSVPTKFLDFRKQEVIAYLDEVVIKKLKENGIGYLKVDYNANIGLGCDGAESLGEGLRQQMMAVWKFFKRMKENIPELVIENCASGGARLDPMMMSVTAMSSFSDAHECFELPIIAANMHYLISPRQSLVWCVLKDEFDLAHMQYIIAAGFLGRLCWSGYIDKLADWQMDMLYEAESLYEKVCHIIKCGKSEIFRTHDINYRNPKGVQAVVRYSNDYNQALIVVHNFTDGMINILLNSNYQIDKTLYETNGSISGDILTVSGKAKTGNVYLINRVK